MGFSLKMFFEDLLLILDATEVPGPDRLDAIAALVKEARQYAEECGQLR